MYELEPEAPEAVARMLFGNTWWENNRYQFKTRRKSASFSQQQKNPQHMTLLSRIMHSRRVNAYKYKRRKNKTEKEIKKTGEKKIKKYLTYKLETSEERSTRYFSTLVKYTCYVIEERTESFIINCFIERKLTPTIIVPNLTFWQFWQEFLLFLTLRQNPRGRAKPWEFHVNQN